MYKVQMTQIKAFILTVCILFQSIFISEKKKVLLSLQSLIFNPLCFEGSLLENLQECEMCRWNSGKTVKRVLLSLFLTVTGA